MARARGVGWNPREVDDMEGRGGERGQVEKLCCVRHRRMVGGVADDHAAVAHDEGSERAQQRQWQQVLSPREQRERACPHSRRGHLAQHRGERGVAPQHAARVKPAEGVAADGVRELRAWRAQAQELTLQVRRAEMLASAARAHAAAAAAEAVAAAAAAAAASVATAVVVHKAERRRRGAGNGGSRREEDGSTKRRAVPAARGIRLLEAQRTHTAFVWRSAIANAPAHARRACRPTATAPPSGCNEEPNATRRMSSTATVASESV